jgi:hypothetical protein
MARLLVVHDTGPSLRVELTGGDDEEDWDGPCSGYGWWPSEGGTDLADAVQAAMVHLDHQH